jgi:hypothetical protein
LELINETPLVLLLARHQNHRDILGIQENTKRNQHLLGAQRLLDVILEFRQDLIDIVIEIPLNEVETIIEAVGRKTKFNSVSTHCIMLENLIVRML